METLHIPYRTLDADIENIIKNNLAHAGSHPYACKNEDIIRRDDNPHDEGTITRPAFVRDTEKIINLPAYNQYADKTQVFSFVQNDTITRRGLHVQLVSKIARRIGSLLGLNNDLIEAIALGHDLGHTPFGHAGERYLSSSYLEHTGRIFRHNVQSVRVMETLYQRNISLQTLDGALCHNGEFACQKLSCSDLSTFEELNDNADKSLTDRSFNSTLRPCTLEGCVVRVSDMIAYIGKDRQDAISMGIIDSYDVFESEYLGADNARFLNNMIVDIINNSFGKDHIEMSREAFLDIAHAKKQNYELIYNKEGMQAEDKSTVEMMFREMYELLRDELIHEKQDSPIYLHHIKRLCQYSRSITPETYLQQDPDQIVVDYISSMTDSYFVALYEYLFPASTKKIYPRDYCFDLPARN